MASFSSIFTSLTGAGFYYNKSPRHASHHFNQEGQSLYRNQPRFPFQYYVNISLNKSETAGKFYNTFFNSATWDQIAPLIKSVEMPSFKIETEALNQYNRKRISQTKIEFEPIKMVFHDVADGKTLKFWEMYYRYYFADGTEPGRNAAKSSTGAPGTFSVESFKRQFAPSINPNIANLPSSIRNLFQGTNPSVPPLANTDGSKQDTQNIVADALINHNFGFNLPQVQNERNLIQTIDIYQVHAGRFNQVTLVNPRIAAFSHDVLNYATTDKTLELTFTFEYEYAYYTVQNLELGSGASNPQNTSSTEPFEHGEFLELPSLAFNVSLLDFIESNNPLLQSDNPILQRIGKNVQSSIGDVTGAFASDKIVRRVSASALNGLANISPTPYHPTKTAVLQTRPFKFAAARTPSAYTDVNRTGGNSGG
jgi:hypothetical protein